MTLNSARPALQPAQPHATVSAEVSQERAFRNYSEVSERLQPYPDRDLGDPEYLHSLPQRWGEFADEFARISNKVGQLI